MEITILERRRIEAEILGGVYRTMKTEVGEKTARHILERTIANAARAHGHSLAASHDGETSLGHFAGLLHQWSAGGALEIDIDRKDAHRLEFRVTRCRYAEMYMEMGLDGIGDLLSCSRDGKLCEGYDDKLKLTRTQTIMEGATHCDFKYHYED